MKNHHQPTWGKPRLISRSVWAALALLGTPYAAANTQFADVPAYLQSESVMGEIKVKPKVMLLIDDSGSMVAPVLDGRGRSIGTRLSVTKTALKAVLNGYTDKVDWGLQTLNNSSNYSGYTSNHKEITTLVDRIKADGGTPTTRRYYEVSQTVRNSTAYRCEKNYIVMMSDGDANLSCFFRSDVPSLKYPASPADEQYFGSAVVGQCAPDNVNGGYYDSFFDRNDGLRFFSSALFNKDFKTGGNDRAGKSWDGDPSDPKDGSGRSLYEKQIIETFTVGFGDSLTPAGRSYLERGAATKSSQGFFSATSAQELVGAFGSIFADIDAKNAPTPINITGTTAPAATAPGRTDSAAIVELDSGSWSSRLKFPVIRYVKEKQADGSEQERAVVDVDNAAEPSFANRKTILNDGKKNHWVGNIHDETVNNAFFDISGGTPADQLEWQKALLPWTARSVADSNIKTLADTQKYSQPYRIREAGKRDLGDIIDSTLSTIGDIKEGRSEFLVTAANDGMVHLFQSAAGSQPYDLKVSYIPAGMERDSASGSTTMGKYLKDVAHEAYGKSVPHRYLVNGGIVVRRTAESAAAKGQQSFLFGAMGQGGRGAYALNIGGKDRTIGNNLALSNGNTDSWLREIPLFETAKGEENKLGYTIGTPQIGRVSVQRNGAEVSLTQNVRYAGFLASGYRVKGTVEGKANETALYIYDMLGQEAGSGQVNGAEKGTLIQKIEVPNGVGGLSSPTLVDTDFDGIVDIAYAGDYGGNMYRFDLRGSTPADWKAERIYTGDAKQPITAAPAVSRRAANQYVVIFGTGSDIYQDDRDNTDTQSVYGIFDDLSQSAANVNAAALLTQNLIEAAQNGQTVYQLSNHPISPNHKGWKIDLTGAAGERVVVKPTMILRTAVISTRSYRVETKHKSNNGDVCIPDETTTGVIGSSMLLGINAETGGMPAPRAARVQFIQNNDATQPYYTGIRQDGITSFTFVDGSKKKDTPVTADGDSGGNGTDESLKTANKDTPVNQCFNKKELRTLITNQGQAFNVTGRICGLQRISWRELFF